jgi:hypothetical protein
MMSYQSKPNKEKEKKSRPPVGDLLFFGSPCWAERIFIHAYSRKYSRFVRLRLLGFKTPYFRNLPSQNNTQLFCSVAYRLRVVQSRKSA